MEAVNTNFTVIGLTPLRMVEDKLIVVIYFLYRFDVERSRHTYPMVFLYNSIPKSNNFAVNDLFDITLSNFIDENHLILENDKLKVRFSSFGLLQSVFDKKSKMITEVV